MRRWPKMACCLVAVVGAAATSGGAESWRLASQAYTFRSLTFFETVDTLASLGVKYVEAYPGQRIGGDVPGKTHHAMDEETRGKVLAKLKEAGVKLACYGVVSGRDETDWRRIFEFAKAAGIETITSEPDPRHMGILDKLCEEYAINVAIHNHPKASRYWNPDTVLGAVRGRSKRIGACADTGHWVRSGLDPLECLKKLEGRIVSLHFKDLNEKGRRGHDVPWGTGACGADAMLAELRRQGFKGVFSIEYEHNTPELAEDVRKCVDYFRIAGAEMVADVGDVWKGLTPDASGRWPEGGPAAGPVAVAADSVTKGYIDTTDDRKGRITACGPGFRNEGPEKAFDNSTRSKFCIETRSIWLQYEYADGARRKVTAYAIASANDNPRRDPRDWKLLASNDGERWDVVDERSGQSFPSRLRKRLFEVKKPAEYSHYKLDVVRNHGDVSSQLSEFELLVKK
ncbi:MAG: TIM barrel protein [Planctomycetota bacterium]